MALILEFRVLELIWDMSYANTKQEEAGAEFLIPEGHEATYPD